MAMTTARPDRGRSASTPTEIPQTGWKDILWRVYNGVGEDRILAIAGGVTFYALLAIFPALAALVSAFSWLADPAMIDAQIGALAGLMPEDVISFVRDQLTSIAGSADAGLGLASIAGFLVSIWSANAGMKALFDALNVIYGEREKRGFVRLNLVSLGFTLLGVILLSFALAAMLVLGPAVQGASGAPAYLQDLLRIARWPLLLIVVSLAISVLYRYGPSRDEAKWRWVSWGGVFAAVGWLVTSILFSWYAKNIGHFNETYGALGAVMSFMVWLWVSSIVLLIGAKVNAEMEHQTKEDTTVGEHRPLGERGAVMADTVGEAADR
ncbi:YihY/virulence factor BrkB family protein [Methylocystis sp. L43]|jgi:membrane protein|uniref:YihY/virulence factor BrkB family protein n=1 Tax=unclassified Methylocystis TaxID=2625913 RepID=UPI0018C1FDB0|nr:MULTISPECIES: YihY/virulence factor BrkB family protein [unclassified Methylocystis]MBG0799359.1 YihY/virulence factor BrkB family protein [Methylocystis sp. L43]MBG0807141.1 YihY/virulence factor BrkB family protein [Methylocystis sp. H15]